LDGALIGLSPDEWQRHEPLVALCPGLRWCRSVCRPLEPVSRSSGLPGSPRPSGHTRYLRPRRVRRPPAAIHVRHRSRLTCGDSVGFSPLERITTDPRDDRTPAVEAVARIPPRPHWWEVSAGGERFLTFGWDRNPEIRSKLGRLPIASDSCNSLQCKSFVLWALLGSNQ
jgi:hypothetical protein